MTDLTGSAYILLPQNPVSSTFDRFLFPAPFPPRLTLSPLLKLRPSLGILALRGISNLVALLEPPRHLRAPAPTIADEQAEKDLARLFGVGVVDHEAAAEAGTLGDRGDQLHLVVRCRVKLQDSTRRVAQGRVQRREEAREAVRGGGGRVGGLGVQEPL